jgi:hypothetical protein
MSMVVCSRVYNFDECSFASIKQGFECSWCSKYDGDCDTASSFCTSPSLSHRAVTECDRVMPPGPTVGVLVSQCNIKQ